jgi:nucleoside-diphosphate-sugar epimerase
VDKEEKYLITGAGGFIGGWIAETLYLEGKANVRAGIHRWAGAVRLARFPMEIRPCNIMDPEEIHQAMEGVTHVVHCAKGPSAESIIKGTENMLDAALKGKVRRFIHMSTAEVYGNPNGAVDENYRCSKTGSIYGDSKLDAEKVCWEYHAKGLPVTILRPSIVYGPFSKTWTLNIGTKLLSGTWRIFKGVGDGICNLIYVSDLVNAVFLSAKNERAIGEAFNLNGPEAPTWNEYFSKFGSALGLPGLKKMEPARTRIRSSAMVPVRALAMFARNHFERPIKKLAAGFSPAKIVMENLEKRVKLTPRTTDLSLYGRRAYYSPSKIEELLGFEPAIDVDTGLKLSVLWMDQVGIRN